MLKDAGLQVYRRLMDAVDPAMVDSAEEVLRTTPGVLDVGAVRLRWIGHELRAECEIVADPSLPVVDAHAITVNAEHRLIHAVPRLVGALMHADPLARPGVDHHAELAHH